MFKSDTHDVWTKLAACLVVHWRLYVCICVFHLWCTELLTCTDVCWFDLLVNTHTFHAVCCQAPGLKAKRTSVLTVFVSESSWINGGLALLLFFVVQYAICEGSSRSGGGRLSHPPLTAAWYLFIRYHYFGIRELRICFYDGSFPGGLSQRPGRSLNNTWDLNPPKPSLWLQKTMSARNVWKSAV